MRTNVHRPNPPRRRTCICKSMAAQVGPGVLVVDVPLAIGHGRVRPDRLGRSARADASCGGRNEVSVRLADQRLVLRGPAHAAHVPAAAGVALEVADAVEDVVGARVALEKAVPVVSVRQVVPARLVAFSQDGCVSRPVANDVDVAGANRCTGGEGILVLVLARGARGVGNRAEVVAVEGDGRGRGVEDLDVLVVAAALGDFGDEEIEGAARS